MTKQLSLAETLQKLRQIKQKNTKPHIKALLMESFLSELKKRFQQINSGQNASDNMQEIISQKQLQYSQTNFTTNHSTSTCLGINLDSPIEIEKKILQKQREKVIYNEEIEEEEDDLFELQKVIQSKKQYEARLDKLIFEQTIKVEQMSKLKRTVSPDFKTTHGKHGALLENEDSKARIPFSARLKNFFM